MTTHKVVGAMSGSSLDGLDLAYCHFTLNVGRTTRPLTDWSIERTTTLPYTPDWQARLRDAPACNGQALWQLHTDYGRFVGRAIRTFLNQHDLTADLVGSHGHTVFHFPEQGFTAQIGDGAALAAACGLPTVTELRSLDVAHGGQGAPLAPLADKYCFGEYDFCLNLGGIANVSARLPKGYLACDVTFANQLLDRLAQRLGQPFDAGGTAARRGRLLPDLLQQLDALPYIKRPAPKSLDNGWVRERAWPIVAAYEAAAADLLHTACRHIARNIADQLVLLTDGAGLRQKAYRMLITGGGAYNTFLLECLQEACQDRLPCELVIPSAAVIEGKEAMFIGLAAALRVLKLPNALATATGASQDCCNGALYYPLTNPPRN